MDGRLLYYYLSQLFEMDINITVKTRPVNWQPDYDWALYPTHCTGKYDASSQPQVNPPAGFVLTESAVVSGHGQCISIFHWELEMSGIYFVIRTRFQLKTIIWKNIIVFLSSLKILSHPWHFWSVMSMTWVTDTVAEYADNNECRGAPVYIII